MNSLKNIMNTILIILFISTLIVQAQDENLIAYYKLDGNLIDEMGLSDGFFADGNIADSANKYIDGYDGTSNGAILFGGTSNTWYRVDLGNFSPVQLGTTGEMTVTFWAYWNGSTGSWQDIINKRDDWSSNGMVWGINQHAATGSVLSVRQPNSNADSKVSIPVGKWTHVAIETDGNNAYFFINGLLKDTEPYKYGTKYSSEIHMGTSPNGAVDAYNGALDEVRFYSRVLTEVEVQAVMSGGNPVPIFSYVPEIISINDTVYFDASGSFDSDGSIVDYSWDFGDGETGSEKTTNHLYKSSGDYTVTLTVTDNDNNSSQRKQILTVYSGKPFAKFKVLSPYPIVNQDIYFDASDSWDADGSIVDYQWEFGDGKTDTGVKVSHSFTNAGTYSVTLTVTDNDGKISDTTKFITVFTGTEKPRIIATTDGEIDDRSTMIRFLASCSDFDVDGIVQVNSRYQKNGHSSDHWIENEIDAYESVLTNLRVHNPDYPDADYLRSVVRVGNENINDLYTDPPDMLTKNTPGEQLIIQTLLDNDPRPVHVVSWGGANTTASALWRLKYSGDYTKEQFNKAVSKIRIYCIWYQDGGGQWIEDNVKEAYINEAYRWDNVWDYQSTGNTNPPEQRAYMTSTWLDANVKTGHGPLGALYPQSYTSEGDTPSFLHLINNGLKSYRDYTLGGWGGRSAYDDPVNKPNHLTDQNITDDGNQNKMYWRWIIPAQNNFAARMDWCVASNYNDANHQPVVKINGSYERIVTPGQTITLDASPTTDPDGDQLSYLWWEYYDADNAISKVSISNSTSRDSASFVVPNEAGKEVHIILTVTDDGVPNLESYARIIFKITAATSVGEKTSSETRKFKLSNNYPNPFNPETTIEYSIASKSFVQLKIFDLLGREVETLVDKEEQTGRHAVKFNSANLNSGVYFYRIKVAPVGKQVGNFIETKKMILLK